MLVVILAGLLLGGVLAHFFGGSKAPQKPAPNAVAVVTAFAWVVSRLLLYPGAR